MFETPGLISFSAGFGSLSTPLLLCARRTGLQRPKGVFQINLFAAVPLGRKATGVYSAFVASDTWQ